jgi:hypothetical protein
MRSCCKRVQILGTLLHKQLYIGHCFCLSNLSITCLIYVATICVYRPSKRRSHARRVLILDLREAEQLPTTQGLRPNTDIINKIFCLTWGNYFTPHRIAQYYKLCKLAAQKQVDRSHEPEGRELITPDLTFKHISVNAKQLIPLLQSKPNNIR